MEDPRVGAVLDGRYEIVSRIAAGGMGIVYQGERLRLGRKVAIKFLHAGVASNDKARKRFEIEAQAMGRLQHPNCAAVIDYGIDGHAPYVVMDFVSGDTLKDLLEDGPLPPQRAVAIVRQILAGLEHAHELGITHRDIKPANIIVTQTAGVGDLVRILDFGLAKLREGTGGLTSGFVIGTPTYMAPEQTLSLPVDARTDVYAVGILLFELLTGAPPYQADEPPIVMMMHREAPVPTLDSVTGDGRFSPELERVIARALAKDPADRFGSAAEMAAALGAVPEPSAGARPAPAEPDSAPERAPAEAASSAQLGTMPTAMMLIAPDEQIPSTSETALLPDHGTPAASATGHHTIEDTPRPTRRSGSHRWLAGAATALALGAALAVVFLLPGDDTANGEPAAAASPSASETVRGDTPPADPEASGERARSSSTPTRDAPPETAEVSNAAREPEPEREPASIPGLERARNLLDAGRESSASRLLVKLRREHPDEAEVHYLLSRAYFERLWLTDGIEAYRAAVERNPDYQDDPDLIKSVLQAFHSPTAHRRAARFLRRAIGDAAVPYLEEMADSHPNPRVRARAARALR